MEFVRHPACEIFPPLSAAEFADLKADIAEQGQLESIKLFEGQVLDGWHRYMACRDLGVVPVVSDRSEVCDPWAFALSQNFYRRHLSVGQRAMIAARLPKRESPGQPAKNSLNLANTRAERAAKVNVSVATVQQADEVWDSEDEDLIAAVDSGEMSVSEAAGRLKKGLFVPEPPFPGPLNLPWVTNDEVEDDVMGQFERETNMPIFVNAGTYKEIFAKVNTLTVNGRVYEIVPEDYVEDGVTVEIEDLLNIKEEDR